MILKSFRILLSLLIIFCFSASHGEEKIDIWKNDKKNSHQKSSIQNKKENESSIPKPIINIKKENNENKIIEIENKNLNSESEVEVYGIYDPADFNFNLNMWSSTKAEDIVASLNRLKKIKLSNTSKEILENILLSFSYPPEGMKQKDFVKLKVNWLIENNRSDLIENFLKQNNEFVGKSKLVQYIVDENISKANIKKGCEKIKFIDSTIKDSYLEKFKIYCLIFNNQKSQARLLLDLLREQNQSDKFFDDKINYLLGVTEKTSSKINEKNLLNFYLSSLTIKDFKYVPSKNTKKEIWKYLNAANLIQLDDINDKKKIKEMEIAANDNQVNLDIIFNIYKQIPFDLNTLINAKDLYLRLDGINARSLIYQKYLLSDSIDVQLEYLFLLENLFKKDGIQNLYYKFLSNSLKNIGLENIPDDYKEIAESRIILEDEFKLGKIKYNEKIFHQSKIIKLYVEKEESKKVQKEIDKIFRKLSKNKKYFYSAKDLALIDALKKDGFNIPENLKLDEKAQKYEVPKNLVELINKQQSAFLALKIVEIIGEDEPFQLDPETIYFITNLLNKTDLIKIRNKVLISALPLRV